MALQQALRVTGKAVMGGMLGDIKSAAVTEWLRALKLGNETLSSDWMSHERAAPLPQSLKQVGEMALRLGRQGGGLDAAMALVGRGSVS